LTLDTAPATSPSAIGDIAAPASSAEQPWASCRYWVIAKIDPNSENEATLIDREAMLKRGLRR
jgi:hypothetical protein